MIQKCNYRYTLHVCSTGVHVHTCVVHVVPRTVVYMNVCMYLLETCTPVCHVCVCTHLLCVYTHTTVWYTHPLVAAFRDPSSPGSAPCTTRYFEACANHLDVDAKFYRAVYSNAFHEIDA